MKLLPSLALLLAVCSLSARTVENFDRAWRFARFGAMSDGTTRAEPPREQLAAPEFADAAWRTLNLPHDWGIEGPFRFELPGDTGKLPWVGIGWYRKTFTPPAASSPGARTWLEIDGAMSQPEIFLNGVKVGEWKYGYTSFRVELTAALKPGAPNTLALRLENLPDSSRWYPGAGLYRHVRLVQTAASAIDFHGVYVRTPQVSAEQATIVVKTELLAETLAGLKVAHELLGPDGRRLATAENPAGAVARFTLAKPALWDTATPHLYRLVTTLRDDKGNTLDRVETTFGLRDLRFDAHEGFFLNGRRVALRGVCNHHDLGALGSAWNTRAAERQLELLLAMGFNALRTSHNPPAPELLDLCDRLGILVFNETFDGWAKHKTPNDYGLHFDAWHERDLRAHIRRDRNHPSVIAWSVGNEVIEQKPPEKSPLAHELVRRLRGIVLSEDATRPVTVACDHPKTTATQFGRELDLYGFNYKPRLYAQHRKTYPDEIIYASETASTLSTRGEYFFPVSEKRDGGFFNYQASSYDLFYPPWAQTPDTEFAAQEANSPAILGEFVWTGFDYLGEPTPYGSDASVLLNFRDEAERAAFAQRMKEMEGKSPSRSSYFGIIDLAGFPKDRFYLYQAHWRPDLPMAHLLPHWTWPGREGEVTPVHAYTSGDEAELFLNGQSLGRKQKQKSQYRLRWDDVKYAPGELKLVAYKNGREWATATQRTAGAAAKLEAVADRATIRGDGHDLSFITIRVLDAAGNLVPQAKPLLKFKAEGAAEFVAADNGDPIDLRTFSEPQRHAFNGLALAILRSKPGASGAAKLMIECEGLPPVTVTLTVEK